MKTYFLVLVALTGLLHAQSANDLFQKQDWGGAEKLYRSAVTGNPSDGLSWFRLGVCLHRLNRNQESRDAFQKALDLRFQPLQAMVVIARSHLKDNHLAEGAKWLTQAVDAGFSNTALLDTDPDFAGVKSDPEFVKLRARADLNAHPCLSRPEYHQFDFWLGEWEVMSPGAPGPVSSRIERLLDGCIIQENWEQVWVAPGSVMKLEGTFRDGAMRFEGKTMIPGQGERWDKLTFTPMEEGRVHQFWQQSTDAGKTWTTSFDGIYSPKRP
jgi:hypothetical protein